MKNFVLTMVAITGTFLMGWGQRYENIKTQLMLGQFAKAKEELDKNWTNAKFLSKPEAYILKATILAQLGNAKDAGEAGAVMIDEAESVYNEYLEKDPEKSLIKDPAYANTPITIYSSLFNRGIGFYNDKNYKSSLKAFEKVSKWSTFLNSNGIAEIPLDTNAILLAGASAQATGENEEEAFMYYKKLADNKVGGKDNEFLYRFLARKSFDQGKLDEFERYMALGKELFPEEEFYSYKEEDFIFSLEDKEEKMRKIEEMLDKKPNNLKVQLAYGEILFDVLNPKNTEDPLPENSVEMETKMVKAFDKASEIDESSPLGSMNLANHFMNKSIRANNTVSAHQKMMRDKQKANTPEQVKGKPAPKPPAAEPADVEKRKELQADYESILEFALSYYGKAVLVYEKMTVPESVDKQNWRNAVSNLIDINKELKNGAIRDKNVTNEKKFDAEEKRYMAMYSKLNQ